MEGSRFRRGGLVGPVILISAGVLFLLNNFGVLDWSVWLTLLRLWPVLLIAIGLDILIGRRSWLGSALVALLLVGVLVAAVAGGIRPSTVNAAGQVDRTETVRMELKGAKQADVEIEFGAGELILGALPADSGDLLAGTVELSRDEKLNQSQSTTNGRARASIQSNKNWSVGFDVSNAPDKQWDLALNRDVPLSLNLKTGVGKSNLDLTQLKLTQVDLNGGVGDVTMKLPAQGRFSVSVDGGVGQITFILPESLAARITLEGGLGGSEIPASFEKRDRVYTSPGFSSAQDRVEINVDGGIGRIVVRQATE